MKRITMAFLIFILAGSIFAEEEIQIVTEEWSPYNFIEEGKIVGISTDIVKETLRRAEVRGTIIVYPWSRAYNMALSEPNTLIYTIYRNEEREDKFKWVGPLFEESGTYLFKLAERTDINLSSIDEAKEYSIGVLKDNFGHLKLLELGFEESVNLEVVRTTESNIQMLLAGRIDMIPGDEIATGIILKEMGLSRDIIVKEISILDRQSHPYMAFSKSTPDTLVEEFRRVLKELHEEDLIERTIDKYRYVYE